MSTQAAKSLGLPPGFCFRPDDDELIELFLLRSVRGEAPRLPGVVITEDDTAANTLPWKLLKRHGMADDDEAYFFVRTTNSEAAGRQDRYCDGDATWVSQRPVPGVSCVAGQEIKWRRVNLNLHMGRGKSGGGSTGWVMHEYTVTEPPCPFLKICHIAFTGHGKERKRVPDEESDEPASKRARVEADANDKNGSTTDDEFYGTEYLTGDVDFDRCAEAFYQEFVAIDKSLQRNRESTKQIQATVSEHQDPCVAQASAYQHVPIDQGIPPMNQQLLDQDLYVAHASAYQPLPTDQGISPINQQLLDLDQDPSVSLGSAAYQPFPSDQGFSPINQELLDGADMPIMERQDILDAQLEPLQGPSWSFPLATLDGADLYLEQEPEEQLPMEHQSEEDQQERLYWMTSIGIDIDNIIF
ncbi:hypothetical protein HU200_049320 [Digitaria exilis]|uniref:NAC domain-containing protein n=1 Tax=Digitaria exilis TaxID=1010633 RepID=A0A835B4N6_9POAL|nr:hypothetical protein HU200_049320 [Digitaria exilis]